MIDAQGGTKQDILVSARDLFASHGYDGTSAPSGIFNRITTSPNVIKADPVEISALIFPLRLVNSRIDTAERSGNSNMIQGKFCSSMISASSSSFG